MKKNFFAIAFLFLFIASSFAQEGKELIYEWDSFDGGLATKISDNSIPKNYASVIENIRTNTSFRSLSKRPQVYIYGTVSPSEASTGLFRLYLSTGTKVLLDVHADQIDTGNDSTGAFTKILDLTTSGYKWQWLAWHNLGIGTDGYNQPVKYDGSSASATYLGTCLALDAGSGAGPNGAYTYKVSFYTASYEVLFNVASNSVTVTDNDINLSMIPIAPDTYGGEAVTGRRIYRSDVGGAGTYNMLTNGQIANNTAVILTDSDTDAECDVGAAYPAGTETWTPPKGKLSLVANNRLWIANNPTYPSRLYPSEYGSHDCFKPTLYYDIRANDGDEITFIKTLLGKMAISKTTSIQKFNFDGDSPTADWGYSDPYNPVGCIAYYSAVNTPIGIIYLGNEGLYVFNGQTSSLLSDIVTPTVLDISASNLVNVWADFSDNLYYLAYTSKSNGGSVNDRILIYDILSKSWVIDTFGVSVFHVLKGGSDGNVLYAGSSSDGKIYTFKNTSQEITHKVHSDFAGTFDDSRYVPVASGGNSSSPVIELSWDVTIDGYGAGTINAATGDVNRPDTGGTYVSQVLSTPGASAYDKIYWNETLPSGTDATLAIRSGATSAACQAAGWSSEYTNSAGSDISAVSANAFTQYRITLSTGDIDYTPNVINVGGFNVKLTYGTLGTAAETAIAMLWESGFTDLGHPLNDKLLKKFSIIHEGTNGTLTVTFTNELGDSDTFNIALGTYPNYYEEYFTDGTLRGRRFKLTISNSDINALEIKKVGIMFDIEPLI